MTGPWQQPDPFDPYRQQLPATRPISGPGPYPPQQYPASPVPYGYTQPPIMVTPAKPSSGWAVWALVVGLVGFFFGWCLLGIPCLAAVILGHVAIADTKNDVKSGRGMAVAGLVLGYLAVAPAIILFFWVILGAGASVLPGVSATPTP
jgi:hypothetical protein